MTKSQKLVAFSSLRGLLYTYILLVFSPPGSSWPGRDAWSSGSTGSSGEWQPPVNVIVLLYRWRHMQMGLSAKCLFARRPRREICSDPNIDDAGGKKRGGCKSQSVLFSRQPSRLTVTRWPALLYNLNHHQTVLSLALRVIYHNQTGQNTPPKGVCVYGGVLRARWHPWPPDWGVMERAKHTLLRDTWPAANSRTG